jgi:hypothetical protein
MRQLSKPEATKKGATEYGNYARHSDANPDLRLPFVSHGPVHDLKMN